MEEITVKYQVVKTDGGLRLCFIALDQSWNGSQATNLFSEAAEGLFECSYSEICFDLSSLTLVSSTVFGVCVNLIGRAKDRNKKISFRFNKQGAETARMAYLDKRVSIEEV